VTLIVSRGETARRGQTEEHPLVRESRPVWPSRRSRSSAGQRCSASWMPVAVAVAFVLMTAGIIAFVASSALFALPRSRRG
jgi:hypothetical protein